MVIFNKSFPTSKHWQNISSLELKDYQNYFLLTHNQSLLFLNIIHSFYNTTNDVHYKLIEYRSWLVSFGWKITILFSIPCEMVYLVKNSGWVIVNNGCERPSICSLYAHSLSHYVPYLAIKCNVTLRLSMGFAQESSNFSLLIVERCVQVSLGYCGICNNWNLETILF